MHQSREPSSVPSVSLMPSFNSSAPSVCIDENDWIVGGNLTFAGLTCAQLSSMKNTESWCELILQQSKSTYRGKAVNEACCACDGSKFRDIAPSSVPSEKPSVSSLPSIEVFPSTFPSTEPSKCVDEPNWHFYNDTGHQLGCEDLIVNYTTGVDMCERFQDVGSDGKTVNTACCLCGGGQHQSREPSLFPSESQQPSLRPSTSIAPSLRPTLIPSDSPSISSLPSFMPSGKDPTIYDGKTCRFDRECLSYAQHTTDACTTEEICKHGVLHRTNEAQSDFKIETNVKYFSPNDKYYLEFATDGLLYLRFANDTIKWYSELASGNRTYIDNTAYLQQNGNLLIYDKDGKVLWYSVQDLSGICESGCKGDENCAPGLKCIQQSSSNDAPNFYSDVPSTVPSDNPSDVRSYHPSASSIPSDAPSNAPSDSPSGVPSLSAIPSVGPTDTPSNSPSDIPSNSPTTSLGPSSTPSTIPSISNIPSSQPSMTNIPGCVGLNDGITNYCVSPDAFDAFYASENSSFPQNKEILNIGTSKIEYTSRSSPLSLCEGHCEIDNNCGPGLICKEQSQGKIEGCSDFSSNVRAGWKYCTYPALTENKSSQNISIDSVNDSFLRIHDTGVLQVYSKSQGLIWDSEEGVSKTFPCKVGCTDNKFNEDYGFNEDYDLSVTTARDIVFAGDYIHADFVNKIVESSNSGLSVTENSIKVKGSISKAYEFVSPLRVTASRKISFHYKLGDGVVALGLCADDGVKPSVSDNGRVKSTCLALGGTNVEEVFASHLSPSVEEIITKSENSTEVEIDLHKMFPSQTKELRYLGIIQVLQENFLTDSFSFIFNSTFLPSQDSKKLNQDLCVCDSTELAATLTPGLHHTCKSQDDFCTSASNILRQITRNENESCSSNLDCRSGVCDEEEKVCKSTDMIIAEKIFPVKELETPKFICLNTERRSWNDHNRTATDKGVSLASIMCKEQNDNVNAMKSGTAKWIGANYKQTEGKWKWSEDDSDLSYLNWAPYLPNDSNGQDCVVIRDKWYDFDCDDILGPAVYLSDETMDDMECKQYSKCPTQPGAKLKVCEWGCNSDTDCEASLKCDNKTNEPEVDGCLGFREPGFTYCYEESETSDITWAGTYGDQNTFIGKQGGSFVSESKTRIHLYGNVWKAYRLKNPYPVTGNTHVSFKFKLTKEAEGHAICFDDDMESDTYGGFQKRCIAVGGTELGLWNNNHVFKTEEVDTSILDTEPIEVTHQVKIGDFFNERGSKINFIGFVQDNDADPYSGISSFWDITFYEELPNSSWTLSLSPASQVDYKRDSMIGMQKKEHTTSFDGQLEAAVVQECIQTDRSIVLKKDLEITNPGDQNSATTPIRQVKCRKKHCKQYEFSTDLKERNILLTTGSMERLNQMNGVSNRKTKIKLASGESVFLSHNVDVKCPSNHLVTKISEGPAKEHFYIQNRKWTDQYLTVKSCEKGSGIFYSKKGDGDIIQRTFYSNGETLHSVLCGDQMALDLKNNDCRNFGEIHLWETNGSNAQKFKFESSGRITVGSCRLDGGGSANKPSLYVWKSTILYSGSGCNGWTDPRPYYWAWCDEETVDYEWWKWNKIIIPHETREIWCNKPKSNAGLIIDENDTKSTGKITSDASSGDPPAKCPDGYYVTGYSCEDYFCYSISLFCKKVKIVPKYQAKTSLKFFSKSNDWGEPTADIQLEIKDHTITNNERTNSTCINSARLQFDGKGLGFTISSDRVFYYEDNGFTEYTINADGSLTKENKVPVGSCSNDSDLEKTRKPPNFGTVNCRKIYTSNLIGAVSASDTSLHGNPNHGAIAFYHRKTPSLSWKLRGELYGSTDHTKLGLYSLEFEDAHDMKVISDRYHVNYISDVLNECPLNSEKKGAGCYCKEGYITANSKETLSNRVKPGDYCVLAFFSSLVKNKISIDEKSEIELIIKNKGVDLSGKPPIPANPTENQKQELKKYTDEVSDVITISQFSESSNNPELIEYVYGENLRVDTVSENNESYTVVTFIGLNPGRKYLVTANTDGFLTFPIVPSCSCEAITGRDHTGRPKNLKFTQDRGHVKFSFVDNSKCETGFSFSRFEGYAEFVDDSVGATSFTNDFSYQAPKECTATITPETQASDDLTLSRLTVGKVYTYCVRAIKEGNYMDLTINSKETRALASSSATCNTYRINWESSLSGIVTTDPDAGSIPIEKVIVRWQLLSEDRKELNCSNCSGVAETNKGGAFEIYIKIADEPLLYEKNDLNIPIKLFFSKVTSSNLVDVEHRFLCNEGQDVCDNEAGFVTYLKHLHFDTPFHVYDTSVPFTGKLLIHGTQCPVVGADVCPQHKSVAAENNEEEIGALCVKTDSNGNYVAPVVIGSIIYGVRISYESHDFVKTFDNKWNYGAGVSITEGGFYANNDFYDMTKARLFVQVAGGSCDLPLGNSYIQVRVKGCDDDLHSGGFLEAPMLQTTFQKQYDVPAHFLEVIVDKVLNKTEAVIEPITAFFNGQDPIVRSINLVATEEEDEIEDELIAEEDGGDTGTDNSEVKDKSDYKETEESKETVRFQYDGELLMDVEVNPTKPGTEDCSKRKSDDNYSFHVVEYMSVIDVSVKLKFKIIDDVFCNIVDPGKHKLSIVSNLGMDSNDGFVDFYNGLPTEQEKQIISSCSTIAPPSGAASGPCLEEIYSGESGSGKDFKLVVGRPNINLPFTKIVNLQVIGAATNVQHKADFFIEGQVSFGAGDSFALPTHKPIMVLRDPPGGGSYASYNNIRSSVRIYSNHDKTSNDGKVAMKLGIALEADTKLCTGGGIGAMVLGCKEAVGGDNDTDGKSYQDIKVSSADSTKTITNSFSTTWSYTTSASADIAGEESDIFVVPNLNVFYMEVYLARFDNEKCKAALDGNEFPSTTIFDIDAETNKPALSFYSRHHIETTKMPEIDSAIDGKLKIAENVNESMTDGTIKICCDKGKGKDVLKGYCLPTEGTLRQCTEEDLDQVAADIAVLMESLVHWESILYAADVTKQEAIEKGKKVSDWFNTQQKYQEIENVEFTEKEKGRVRMEKGETSYSNLAPESLTDIMQPFDSEANPVLNELEFNKKSAAANRIQFSGNSGSYTITLDRSSTSEYTVMACQDEGIMKAMALWQKIISFDPVAYAKKKLVEKTGETILGLTPVTKSSVKAFFNRFGKYAAGKIKEKEEEVKKKREEEEKTQKRLNAIKKTEDARKQRLENAQEETKRIQDEIDNEKDIKKKKKLITQKFLAITGEKKAQEDLEESVRKAELEKKKMIKAKAISQEIKAKKATPEETITKKNAMREERKEELQNKEKKDRSQTTTAEASSESANSFRGGSFLKKALEIFKFAFSSGPMVIASLSAYCNSELKSAASPADLDLSTSVFGVGVDAYFNGNFQAVVTHESFQTDIEGDETSVSFTFEDPDIDDEFVVDIYYDEYYGTFIFNTVAGRSKCVWEKGTARSEDPSLISINSASSFIYPDEKMVFEVEMKNIGRTSDSFFYVAQEQQGRNLDVKLGGTGIINENGITIKLFKNKPVMKQIVISRGLIARGVEGYEFPALQLTLKSKCEADMNVRQNTNDGIYRTETLFNSYNEKGDPVLKWVKPCPMIHWSGELKRDRSFLVNQESKNDNTDNLSILKIPIFNPLRSKGQTIEDLYLEGNLENVFLRFREKGDTIWEIAQSATPSGELKDMDYLDQDFQVEEDSYGFASLFWRFDNVKEGDLEIMLETKCTAPGTAPDEVKGFHEEIISGAFDLQPPKQYGRRALPLRHDILFGEELQVLFTENIRCSKPHMFTISVDIIGTNFIGLTNKNQYIQVRCHDNLLGFQLQNLLPENVAGKEFRVTIDNVEDTARNTIENTITFKKRFANLDFDGASTTFKFTMTNATCTDKSVESQSDDVRLEIASRIGLNFTERVKIHSLLCLDESKVIADAEILPEQQNSGRTRNLLRTDYESTPTFGRTTHQLVVDLQKSTENDRNLGNESRSLMSISDSKHIIVSSIGIKPSEQDRSKYKRTKEELAEEHEMRSYIPQERFSNAVETGRSNEREDSYLAKNEIKDLKISLLKESSEIKELRDSFFKQRETESSQIKDFKDSLLKEKKIEFEKMEMMVVVQGSIILLAVGSFVAFTIYLQRKQY